MATKKRIGVVFGGKSPEHDISVKSAATVISLLDREKFTVIPIGITRQGEWRTAANSTLLLEETLIHGKPFEDWGKLNEQVDILFPCLHGVFGEDGTIQGLCEMADIPYVGCGVLSSALGINKDIQQIILRSAGLPIPKSVSFTLFDWKRDSAEITSRILSALSCPVFVKPCRLGSSIGIELVTSHKLLANAVDKALQYDHKILVEEGVCKAREFQIGIIGNDDPESSVVGETISSGSFLDFDSKYIKPHQVEIPAKIPEPVSQKLRNLAIKAYMALECRGFSRVDFLATPDFEEIFIGEINTIPGMSSSSMFLKLWEKSGKSPRQVIEQLIELAEEKVKACS